MNETVRQEITPPTFGDLFARVASILEQTQGNVVRSDNANMVLADWLIGREIVQEIQGGEERAEYDKQVLEQLFKKIKASAWDRVFQRQLKEFQTVLPYLSRSVRNKRLCGVGDRSSLEPGKGKGTSNSLAGWNLSQFTPWSG